MESSSLLAKIASENGSSINGLLRSPKPKRKAKERKREIFFGGNIDLPFDGSIGPIFMSNRQAVKRVSIVLPLRHEMVEQTGKTGVVGGLQQMGHLVDDNNIQSG